MTLDRLVNTFAKELYGQTLTKAHEKEICIACNRNMKDFKFPIEEDRIEYGLSGLCPKCFGNQFESKRRKK